MPEHTVKYYEEELVCLNQMITGMGKLTGEQLELAIGAAERSDVEMATRVIEREPEADRMAHAVENLVIRVLALRQPMAIDLRQGLSILLPENSNASATMPRICHSG